MIRASTRALQAAVAVLLALVVAGGRSGAHASAAGDACHRSANPGSAALDSVEVRVGRLEQRLGIGAQARRVLEIGQRYAELRRRELAVAERANAWLRFIPAGSPVGGGVVTSTFSPGRFHPVLHRVIPHVGVDIAARYGTPVHATADGKVFATAISRGYGLVVDIKHGDSGFITRYAHLARFAVRAGAVVRRGDLVGWVGSSGLVTGPHTHYEVFYRGWRRDPVEFLVPAGASETWAGVD
jgi:murein DD-endopeptidase MepM/ murein hydrolase activator NlpD